MTMLSLRSRISRTPNAIYGPQSMSIAHPLSRAALVAERSFGSRDKSQAQKESRLRRLYYRLPPFPRTRRNVLYFSTRAGSRYLRTRRELRLPGIQMSKRLLSAANQGIRNKTKKLHSRFFSSEARTRRRQRREFIAWWTLTSLTIILASLMGKVIYDRKYDDDEFDEEEYEETQTKPQSWHLYAYSVLPLKAISRMWGVFNSINLPVWLRVPSYKFYSSVFGVNLDEIEESDLTTYRNLSEFFYRRLKPGVRPIADTDLVSPADGKILKCGIIEDGEIEQVKGMTYSIDSLLGFKTRNLAAPSYHVDFDKSLDEETVLERHQEFARINGISYSVDDLIGGETDRTFHEREFTYKDKGDGTAKGSKASVNKEISVASELARTPSDYANASRDKLLFFSVIYLAPGDYHRFHSPANWVTNLRRHFVGELFSVSPFFQRTLEGLFVLNERVALLGYWKYGFFSMTPVGATNVGSIVVNFDKDLKTNIAYEDDVPSRRSLDSNSKDSTSESSTKKSSDANSISSSSTSVSENSRRRRLRKNTIYEATYWKASKLLAGVPLNKGQEMGGFKLGSTVVLVFEAPENFRFNIEAGEKVKVGQRLGSVV